MPVCRVNSGRFKAVKKNILSWFHSWLTCTHSQNKCATVSLFEWQMEHRGESIYSKKYVAFYLHIACNEVFCIGSYVDSY